MIKTDKKDYKWLSFSLVVWIILIYLDLKKVLFITTVVQEYGFDSGIAVPKTKLVGPFSFHIPWAEEQPGPPFNQSVTGKESSACT